MRLSAVRAGTVVPRRAEGDDTSPTKARARGVGWIVCGRPGAPRAFGGVGAEAARGAADAVCGARAGL